MHGVLNWETSDGHASYSDERTANQQFNIAYMASRTTWFSILLWCVLENSRNAEINLEKKCNLGGIMRSAQSKKIIVLKFLRKPVKDSSQSRTRS